MKTQSTPVQTIHVITIEYQVSVFKILRLMEKGLFACNQQFAKYQILRIFFLLHSQALVIKNKGTELQ